MVFEILFSGILFVLAGYCLGYVQISSASTVYTDPLGTAFWPSALLSLLMVLLVINIISVYRKTPKEKRNFNCIKNISIKKILSNRLFLGMVILVVYAILLPYFGFLTSTFFLSMAMCCCLGETRPKVLVLFSFALVVAVFIIFFRGMAIQLPRGTIPFFRNMAITIESFLRSIGK